MFVKVKVHMSPNRIVLTSVAVLHKNCKHLYGALYEGLLTFVMRCVNLIKSILCLSPIFFHITLEFCSFFLPEF